jgi:hypothetical protein
MRMTHVSQAYVLKQAGERRSRQAEVSLRMPRCGCIARIGDKEQESCQGEDLGGGAEKTYLASSKRTPGSGLGQGGISALRVWQRNCCYGQFVESGIAAQETAP